MIDEAASPLNVVAIIQARMGSRRFPGKVLADLRGRPVLEWVVDAVKRVEGVNNIVVATTTNSEDEAIRAWCEKNTVNCFRGEPLDVLKRYSDCAKEYGATHVVRITADCPLLDSETVSTVLREGIREAADYFGLDGSFPDGFDCEGFRADALFRANSEATSPSDREHVTPYFKNEPGVFRSLFVELWSDMAEFRLTIDEPADLAYIETVLSLVPSRGTRYSSHAILKVVKQRQDLRELNAHIPRNEGYAHSLNLESGGA
jgi:spore coat polysaccharide biosynthesis protein SpsF